MLPRKAVGIVLLVVLGLALHLALSTGVPSGQEALARAVNGVGMTVSDMDRAVDFYSRVLFFEKVSDVEVSGPEYERLQGVSGLRMRVVRMKLGDEAIELTEYLTPKGRPIPVDSRSNDRWFQHIAIIVNDMDQAYLWLRRHKVEHASPEPQRLPDWNPNAAGIRAFYFKDPDGHPLEILQFPPDKGDARWHRPSDRVFLGIDHTAIVVGDTEQSLRFYRDALGMKVAARSENWGPEQERLNNVAGARLRITTLRAAAGPAVEFLEYLMPQDGRSMSADTRANDLVHWHTILTTADVPAAATALRLAAAPISGPISLHPGAVHGPRPQARIPGGPEPQGSQTPGWVGFGFVSPDAISIPDGRLGFRQGLLLRDSDGHAVQFRSS
jgi:catechol 2,3-dioxygenase-like lactoylglutathione lyase family enzyme